MSLSAPRSQSPVKRFFRLKAGSGDVIYYDKSQGKEVAVGLPFRAIILDSLNTVGGFHEPSNSGIWANEVRSSNETLTVRSKNGVLIEGAYSSIKDRLRGLGGKFAYSVYVAYHDGNEWALGNLNLIGAGLGAWFDFGKGRSFDTSPGVAVTGFSPQTKGRTEYFVPTFESWTVPASDLSAAEALDRDLQAYLNNRGGGDVAEESQDSVGTAPSFGAPSRGFGEDLQPSAPF